MIHIVDRIAYVNNHLKIHTLFDKVINSVRGTCIDFEIVVHLLRCADIILHKLRRMCFYHHKSLNTCHAFILFILKKVDFRIKPNLPVTLYQCPLVSQIFCY